MTAACGGECSGDIPWDVVILGLRTCGKGKGTLAIAGLLSLCLSCSVTPEVDNAAGLAPTSSNFGLDGGQSGQSDMGDAELPDGLEPGTLPEACGVRPSCPVSAPRCLEGSCVECLEHGDCDTQRPYCVALSHVCVACVADVDCAADESCLNGACVPSYCEPGETRCNGAAVMTCAADGVTWEPSPCETGLCVDGACAHCDQECEDSEVCWQGQCLVCKPFTKRCNLNVVEACSEQGVWEVSLDCADQGFLCWEPGYCASACSSDPKFNNSNSGCEYWAVDLDNHYGAQESPFAVIVSNLSPAEGTVSVSVKSGPEGEVEELSSAVLEPGALHVFDLPSRQPGGSGVGWWGYHIEATTQIVAYQFNPLDNVDVFSNDASLLLPENTLGTAYRVFSMPEYLGTGPSTPPGGACADVCAGLDGGTCLIDPNQCLLPYRGFVTVMAVANDTQVSITASSVTQAGPGFNAMSPGQVQEVTLQAYQVLNVKTDGAGADLTGTLVTSTKPVAVFGGHEASLTSPKCCADHLEEQMFPLEAWGSQYIATKSKARGLEPDYWRVMAAEDGTVVSFDPQVRPAVSLDAGQWIEFQATADFVVSATKPVGIAQILASSQETLASETYSPCTNDADCHQSYACLPSAVTGTLKCIPPACGEEGSPLGCPGGHTCDCFGQDDNGTPTNCSCRAVGDPALILLPPTEQMRQDYVFLTPDKYQDDYVNIVATTSAEVYLDGIVISAPYFDAVGDTGFRVARLQVSDGVHEVTATEPVGIIVYGYDRDVSYGYTAGLNLQTILNDLQP